MPSINVKKTEFQTRLPAKLFLRPPVKSAVPPSQVILLSHGYSLSGEIMLERFKDILPEDALVIAPNGPFPVPQRTSDGYKEGYSWYFYDFKTDEYIIDMNSSVEMWKTIVNEWNLQRMPKRLLGYSQGGYLSPFVAQELENVKQVLGVACEFLIDELKPPFSFRMDAVHGKLDPVVSFEGSKAAHSRLLKMGIVGQYVEIPDEAHRPGAKGLRAIKELLLS